MANLKKSRLANKAWFDKKKRLRPEAAPINKGNMVLLHDTKLDNQHTDKLADRWGGPFIVHRILDGGAYVLTELDGTRLEGAYSGNRLKRYWEREPAKRVKEHKEGKNVAVMDNDMEIDVEDNNVVTEEDETEGVNDVDAEEDVEDMEVEKEVETEVNDIEKEDLISKSGFFVLIP